MKKMLVIAALLTSSAFVMKAEEPQVAIARILAQPAAFTGKFVALHGTVTKIQETAAFTFYVLDDGSGTVKVRTARKGRINGEERTVRGRVRQDALLQLIYVVEDDIGLGGNAEEMLGDSAGQGAGRDTTPRAGPIVPGPTPHSSSLPVPAQSSIPVQRQAPPSSSPASHPASTPGASPGGLYALLFDVAPAQARDVIITQIGRLATGTVHPTCSFVSNKVVSREAMGSSARVRFRSVYDNLLLGELYMVWELIFDSNGNVADINFVSDSSPLTDVGLLNKLKDLLIQFLQDQLRQLQATIK